MVRATAIAVALFLSPMSSYDAHAAEDHVAASSTVAPARATGSLLLFATLVFGSRPREATD